MYVSFKETINYMINNNVSNDTLSYIDSGFGATADLDLMLTYTKMMCGIRILNL